MPLAKPWSSFTRSKIKDVPNNIGIYEIAREGGGSKTILYIGEGKLRNRLIVHLPGRKEPIPGSLFRVKETQSKRRSKQLERKHLRRFKNKNEGIPRYNTQDIT